MTKSLIILKTGSTLPGIAADLGDFEDWIAGGLGLAETGLEITVVDPRDEDSFPHAGDIAGIVVTGSGAMVTDREAWSENSAAWLREMAGHDIPILGICYGHQLVAHALGGAVGYHPKGIEIGTATVTLRPEAASDPLLGCLPPSFPAQVVHSQTVTSLPPGAVPLAANGFEPHHAFRLGDHIWGVQFHPEFSDIVMRRYLELMEGELAGRGVDAPEVARGVAESGASASLLPRFAAIAREKVKV